MTPVKSIRLDPQLDAIVEQTAKRLGQTWTWVVERALTEFFRQEVPGLAEPSHTQAGTERAQVIRAALNDDGRTD